MKPTIHIEGISPNNFQMQSNIEDKFTIISVLLDIAKDLASQMKKEESPIAKPQLVVQ